MPPLPRPSKGAGAPAPFYLQSSTSDGGEAKYCHACGRIIDSRRPTGAPTTHGSNPPSAPKYCSARCKRLRTTSSQTHLALDARIEATFLALLSDTPLPLPSRSDNDNDTEPAASKPNPNTDTQAAELQARLRTATRAKKGDARVTVPCSVVEGIVFARLPTESLRSLRRGKRGKRGRAKVEGKEWRSVDMESSSSSSSSGSGSEGGDGDGASTVSEDEGGGVALSAEGAGEGAGLGLARDGDKGVGRADGVDDDVVRRREGQQMADEREMVRRAARRACVFGLLVADPATGNGNDGKKRSRKPKAKKRAGRGEDDDDEEEEDHDGATEGVRKKCEAVMGGKVVEPSFAKGDWGIRWRE